MMLLNKDPKRISDVLDFLVKMLEKYENKKSEEKNKENLQRTKEILGIETKKDNNMIMFYQVKCEVLGGASLLEYIDSQGVRMFRQREELLDLAVKIANLNHERDTTGAMEEVINNYKSGLETGEGLRDIITKIKERFPKSSYSSIIMVLISFGTCLRRQPKTTITY